MNQLASIIIPTYNRSQQVQACLESLQELTYPQVEIILVDNGSTDDTCAMVARRFPQVRILAMGKNLGAVGGRNAGLQEATGDYLCLMDSDNVVDKAFLTNMIALAQSDPTIGFVGPKMYYYKEKNRLWCMGVTISLWTSKASYQGFNQIDTGQYTSVVDTDQIPNVWLVTRSVIETIGMLDPVYVMSYGESDWPMRAKQVGFRVVMCPSAVVYHDTPPPASLGESLNVRDSTYRVYYLSRNRCIFMKRLASPIQFALFMLVFNNLFFMLYMGVYLFNQRFDLAKACLKGFLDGLRLVWHTKRFRHIPSRV